MKSSNSSNVDFNMQTFTHAQLGKIRIVEYDYQPWFCFIDICRTLSLYTRSVHQRLNDHQTHKFPVPDAIGRRQQITFVNEACLYDIILDSRKPEAREFRNWIVSEVLPAIRKDGAYVHATANDTEETIEAKARKATQTAIEIYEKKLQTKEREIERQKLELASLDLQLEEKDFQLEAQAPKVNYANALLVLPHACSVATCAKIITQSGYAKFGQNTLFKWLRDHLYLGSKGAYYNLPMQNYLQQGLFVIREKPACNYYGNFTVNYTTYITPKGQQYFLNLFHRLNANR